MSTPAQTAARTHYSALAATAAAYERHLGPVVEPWHHEAARDRVMGDMEDLTDHWAGECFQRTRVDSSRVLRLPSRLAAATEAEVLHALMTSDRPEEVIVCRNELVRRLSVRNAARIALLAQQIAAGEA